MHVGLTFCSPLSVFSEIKTYNPVTDSTIGVSKKRKHSESEEEEEEEVTVKEEGAFPNSLCKILLKGVVT